MRIRATAAVAVVSGALALTAVAIPAAQATGASGASGAFPAHGGWASAHRFAVGTSAGGPEARSAAKPAVKEATSAATSAAASAATAAAEPYPLAVTFSQLKVDNGKPAVVVGTTNTVHVPFSFTLTATNVDVRAADFYTGVDLYRGSANTPSNDLFGDNPPKCSVTSSTSSANSVVTVESCKGTVDIYPGQDLTLKDPGTGWHSVAWAVALNGQDGDNPDPSKIGQAALTGQHAPAIQRYATLTASAKPKPVKKGGTVTVTGKLSRANWDTHKYAGYTGQPVKLQFRKKNSSTYTTLKTVKTDSHGNLKTTYKATADGYWRFSFAGTSTTPAVSAAGSHVSLK